MLKPDTTIAELYLAAGTAKATLRAHAKEIMREFSDRAKKLEALQQEAQKQAQIHGNANTLEGMGSLTLSPELQKLIVNPLHGL